MSDYLTTPQFAELDSYTVLRYEFDHEMQNVRLTIMQDSLNGWPKFRMSKEILKALLDGLADAMPTEEPTP